MKRFLFLSMFFCVAELLWTQTMNIHTTSGTTQVRLAEIDSITFTTTLPSIPTKGLVAYYPFNGNVNDESGNGNHGVVNGATLTTDRFGIVDRAYSFDGTNDWIEIADNTLLKPDTVAISLWVNVRDFTSVKTGGNISSRGQYIIFKENSRGSLGRSEGYNILLFEIQKCYAGGVTSKQGKQVGVSSKNSPVQPLQLGRWYYLFLTANTSKIKFYMDSILQGEATTGFNLDYGLEPLVIGKITDDNWQGYFNGMIDDIRIYNRVLTDNEIQALFYEGR